MINLVWVSFQCDSLNYLHSVTEGVFCETKNGLNSLTLQ